MFSPERSDAANTLAALLARKPSGSTGYAAVPSAEHPIVDSPSDSVPRPVITRVADRMPAASGLHLYSNPHHLQNLQPQLFSTPGKFPILSYYKTPMPTMRYHSYGPTNGLMMNSEQVKNSQFTHATTKKRPTSNSIRVSLSASPSPPKKKKRRGRPPLKKNTSEGSIAKKKRHSVTSSSSAKGRKSAKKASASASAGPKLKTLKGCSRKLKALGLLCARFVIMHHKKPPGETEIRLSQLSERMGIERRRMYDCLNILESIKLVLKQKKDVYMWSGFDNIGKTLLDIKKHADRQGIFAPIPSMGGESTNGGKSKSLAVLAHQFIAMFVTDACGKDAVTLDEAAACLARPGASPAEIKTKARRLYDIANICCTLELVEKFRLPGTSYRKPVYSWIGFRRYAWPTPGGTKVEVPCPVETFAAAGILEEVPKSLVRKWRQKKMAKDLMPEVSNVQIISPRLSKKNFELSDKVTPEEKENENEKGSQRGKVAGSRKGNGPEGTDSDDSGSSSHSDNAVDSEIESVNSKFQQEEEEVVNGSDHSEGTSAPGAVPRTPQP